MSGRLSAVGVVAMALLGGATMFRAEPRAQDPAPSSALLEEVRGLRAALEQLASAGPRVQLVFGRLQLHEQRINALVRRLEAVRERIRPTLREEDQLRTRLKRFEEIVKGNTTLPEDERKDVEAQLPGLRREAARLAYDLQQLQSEEGSLANEISLEQGRWADINRTLDELERSLVRR